MLMKFFQKNIVKLKRFFLFLFSQLSIGVFLPNSNNTQNKQRREMKQLPHQSVDIK